MKKRRRRILLADRNLQGTLLSHTVIYWFYCLFSVSLIAVCWIIFTSKPTSSTELFGKLWANCGPALLGSVALLPLVMMDCLRLSNRFAGPMVRMSRAIKDLAEGRKPREVHLRKGDFWGEFSENLNQVIRDMSAAGLCQGDESARPVATTPDTAEMANAEATPAPCQTELSVNDIYSDVSV